VGGDVQRGQVVQGDVVDLGVVLQQLPHAVDVVALRRHVDGRQAVLTAGRDRHRDRDRQERGERGETDRKLGR